MLMANEVVIIGGKRTPFANGLGGKEAMVRKEDFSPNYLLRISGLRS